MDAVLEHSRCLTLKCCGAPAARQANFAGPRGVHNGLGAVSATSDERMLVTYLQALAGRAPATSFLELRHRVGEQALRAEFVPVREHDLAATAIRSGASERDVYIGCAPRTRRSGTKRDIDQVWVLWAECDGAAAARAATAHRPEPSIVIASGSGPNLHAYWPLREPLSPREAELANLRLAHAFGSDAACYDAARILRPPDTWNHKRHPPTRVTAVRLRSGVAFEAADVIARTPSIDGARVERRWADRGQRAVPDDPLLRIVPAVYVSHLLGVRVRGGHKTRCPFHTDERPSLHVYSTPARGWSCFSCGRGGSIYDLAAEVWGTGTRGREFIELRSRLTERFAAELHRADVGLER
jgi:hypothetical protein